MQNLILFTLNKPTADQFLDFLVTSLTTALKSPGSLNRLSNANCPIQLLSNSHTKKIQCVRVVVFVHVGPENKNARFWGFFGFFF